MADVMAIFKRDRKLLEIYQPISHTSVSGKLLERLVRNEIVKHLGENNLLTSCQHGFIARKSCNTQLFEYIGEITQAL